nr:DUF2752 domain-containing protein [uncultured Sellimonas sp.]
MDRKKWIKESVRMIKEDIWSIRFVILVLGIYFLLAWKCFYSSCPLVMISGFPCPGCGLSRAGFCLLRGAFAQAWYFHPFIYGIALLAAAFVIRRYVLHREVRSLQKYLILLLAGMLIFYMYRMIRYFPGEPPMSYYPGNLLNRISQTLTMALGHHS